MRGKLLRFVRCKVLYYNKAFIYYCQSTNQNKDNFFVMSKQTSSTKGFQWCSISLASKSTFRVYSQNVKGCWISFAYSLFQSLRSIKNLTLSMTFHNIYSGTSIIRPPHSKLSALSKLDSWETIQFTRHLVGPIDYVN